MGLSLVDLRCPRCGQETEGAGEAGLWLWACRPCGLSMTPDPTGEGPLLELQRVALPAGHGEPGLQLPVYELPLLEPPHAGLPARVLVLAVGLGRARLLLQGSRQLTLAAAAQGLPDPVGAAAPAPAELGVEESFELAGHVAMSCVDGWPRDDAAASTELSLGMPRLLDWPFARRGRELLDLVLGMALPAALLDGTPPSCLRESGQRTSSPH